MVGLKRVISPYPPGHPYAVPTFDEIIPQTKAARLEDAKAFHARFYGAQDAKLALVGDFDGKEVTAKLNTLFGTWKATEKYERIPQPYQAFDAKNASLEMPDKANAFYGAALAVPLKDTDPDFPSMVMADFMLGGGFLNGRVTQRLREKDGLSYGAGTEFLANGFDDNGALVGFAIYAPQNVSKVETGFREEVERAVSSGFTDAELKSAREGLKQQRAQLLADDSQVSVRMVEQAELGRTMAYESDLDRKLDALTTPQVGGALKRYVDPSKLAIVKVGDFKKNEAPKRN
jgi:zinc protease